MKINTNTLFVSYQSEKCGVAIISVLQITCSGEISTCKNGWSRLDLSMRTTYTHVHLCSGPYTSNEKHIGNFWRCFLIFVVVLGFDVYILDIYADPVIHKPYPRFRCFY